MCTERHTNKHCYIVDGYIYEERYIFEEIRLRETCSHEQRDTLRSRDMRINHSYILIYTYEQTPLKETYTYAQSDKRTQTHTQHTATRHVFG